MPLAILVGDAAGGGAGEYNGQLPPGMVAVAPGAILMVAGSSLGYFYRGQWLRGLASAGMRIAGLLALPLVVAVCWNDCTGFRRMAGGALLSGGLTLWLGSTYNDITQVEEDVRRANARRGARLEMAPVMDIRTRRVARRLG